MTKAELTYPVVRLFPYGDRDVVNKLTNEPTNQPTPRWFYLPRSLFLAGIVSPVICIDAFRAERAGDSLLLLLGVRVRFEDSLEAADMHY